MVETSIIQPHQFNSPPYTGDPFEGKPCQVDLAPPRGSLADNIDSPRLRHVADSMQPIHISFKIPLPGKNT
jgi:hypothetical protein